VISPNGLLSSLWVWQHKDESNPFLFARQKSTDHVTFEQRRTLNSRESLNVWNDWNLWNGLQYYWNRWNQTIKLAPASFKT
jgi:hypothetical protein